MRAALIGHTGFVGGNLLAQLAFSDCFNSKTIESIRGRSYDLLVCAGAPAEKWRANRDPTADRAALERLTSPLEAVQARRAILISTVDVFVTPIGVDESTVVAPEQATAYGRHRYELERFFVTRFDTLVVRLPGLFGDGLKKNVIFDLLHGNRVDAISPAAEFQFYDLADLSGDIETAIRDGLRLLHCATEPVSVAELARVAFGRELSQRAQDGPPVRYDFRSHHAALFGGSRGYLRDRSQVLAALSEFVSRERDRFEAEARKCA